MALVVLCSLASSTILHMIVVPVLYARFGRPTLPAGRFAALAKLTIGFGFAFNLGRPNAMTLPALEFEQKDCSTADGTDRGG